MKTTIRSNLILFGVLAASAVQADTVDDLLAAYKAQGAGPFNATAGAALWRRKHLSEDGAQRTCTSCHASDLTKPGRHAVTGKTIEPLAPSANARRLSDRRQIEKWLKRNCKWTLGRECTAQEKGDLLSFLRSQ
jgi:hypothetical protein